MEILDAQKERISRIELPSGMESALMNEKDHDALGRLWIVIFIISIFAIFSGVKIQTNK